MCPQSEHKSLGSPSPPWEGRTANRQGQPNLVDQADQSAKQDGCYLDDKLGVNKNFLYCQSFLTFGLQALFTRAEWDTANEQNRFIHRPISSREGLTMHSLGADCLA